MGVLVASGVALAAAVSEAEPNDSIAAAQEIAATSFDSSANTDIFDSTTVPHATVNGTGETGVDPTHDYYKFTVPAGDPVRVVLDIDHTTPDFVITGDALYDPWIELYDSSGTFIDLSDDWGEDPGSPEDENDEGSLDSRIVMEGGNKLSPGTYYVAVGSYVDGTTMGAVPAGATYQLHVSVGNDVTAPDTTIDAGPADGSLENPGFVTFEFSALGEDATFPDEDYTFECRLDDPQGEFTDCFSGQTLSNLSVGSHTFEVRAIDAAGNVDATPASRTWIVSDATRPTIVSTTPPSGATRVSLTNPNITATFSEEMGSFPANSFRLQKVRVQGSRETVLNTVSTTVVNPASLATPNVVRLAPSVTLDKNSYYRVTITTAATDDVGNQLQSGATWRFKTAPR
jgi:Bacterial Ig-like domain/Bacterial pre-peptidase C-terminal domain